MTPFLQLNLFEGPLDLLLHLCRRHELSVVDLPIAQVTEQFLAYLDVMEELEIQIAGEFVEMAALLCLIKSRELLPTPDIAPELLDEGPDPREVLIARLLEYKRFRQAALELGEQPQPRRDYFLRGRRRGSRRSTRRWTSIWSTCSRRCATCWSAAGRRTRPTRSARGPASASRTA